MVSIIFFALVDFFLNFKGKIGTAFGKPSGFKGETDAESYTRKVSKRALFGDLLPCSPIRFGFFRHSLRREYL